jgi:hypothetical protein
MSYTTKRRLQSCLEGARLAVEWIKRVDLIALEGPAGSSARAEVVGRAGGSAHVEAGSDAIIRTIIRC